MIHNQNIGLSC